MKLIAIHKTFDFRGDHEAVIEKVYEVQDGESVEDLWKRLGAGTKSYSERDRSYIQLRAVESHS